MQFDITGIFGSVQPVLKLVGLVTVTYVCIRILWTLIHIVKVFYLSPVLRLHADIKTFGPWAAVTGSTDGIGKAYAEELAKRGLNIVLLSRSRDKLENVAKEIETKYSVKTKIVVVDFTGGAEIYDVITKTLEGLQIGVLVNNVGMAMPYPEYFIDIPNVDKFVSDIINVNVLAVTMMTRILLPQMAQRKKGLVINVASGSGKTPTPLLNVYSATKAYMDFFTRALNVEYSDKGIIIQSVLPFFVSTKMSSMKPSFTVPSAEDYTKQAIMTVGVESRTHGFISHYLQAILSDLLPESIVINTLFKFLKVGRKRYLKRLTKKHQ
ncbi:very-long-chain 3-oxoacyl-CoA reductase-B-like [Glandiceps talaboti]